MEKYQCSARLKSASFGNEQPCFFHSFHEKFELNSVANPHAIAVECGQYSLNYKQLNQKANQLAHHLLERGITKQSVIGVFFEPCVDVLVALLAIHKIGCIYVPLDIHFPENRLNAILHEVSPVAIITRKQHQQKIQGFYDACIDIDNDLFFSDNLLTINPDIDVCEYDTSHIFFTSGTTGKPKGVVATHHNLAHYLNAASESYGFNNQDRFIAVARFTFSISFFELLSPLLSGACVRILQRDEILDMPRLAKHFEWATVFHIGPGLLKQILPYIEKNYSNFLPFQKMRHVSSGGDMVPPDILEKLKKIFFNADVFVIYGSSEISCMGCTYQVPRDKKITRTLVGQPMSNVNVRIEDANGDLVSYGDVGNIVFGGHGLVQGYLGLDELTTEKFIRIDEERWYRIGDIGRMDEEGNVEMLGRKDFQVQIRGMRVELMEVESCLRMLPSVTDVVVVARCLRDDEESLVAYLVFSDDYVEYDKLIPHMSAHLPDYMIPSQFVRLKKLPTNYNGKLDRSALPLPSYKNSLLNHELVPPEDDIEATLVAIWKYLFNVDQVGVTQNFFELGGDSLLAVKYVTAVNKEYQKLVPIPAMLQAPTIREFARILRSEEHTFGLDDVVLLREGNSKPPLYCLYGVLMYKELAECVECDRPVCGVYIEEEVSLMREGYDPEKLEVFSSVEKIAERYEKSIRAFQPEGPYYLCGLSFGGVTAVEVARRLIAAGEEVKVVAMFDSWLPGFHNQLPFFKRLYLHFIEAAKQGLPYLLQKLHAWAEQRQLAQVNVASRHIGADENDVRSQARQLASSQYCPAPFDGDVVLFTAEDRNHFELADDYLGWQGVIKSLSVYTVPGDHLEILKPGNVDVLARQLSPYLND